MPFGRTPLNDGNKIPQIAFGTGSKWKGSDVTDYVEMAIETGFSHIDTAAVYRNEETVAQALRESAIPREELYLTGKYDGGDIRSAAVASLKKLGTKYFDLYLIHNPRLVPNNDIAGAWKEFERIKADGLARSIGVSNFTVEHLTLLLQSVKVVPAVNQVSFNPYNYAQNVPLLEFCWKHGIVVEGYSCLTPITTMPGGPVDEPVQRAADRISSTPAQVILSWVHSKGVVIVTTSSKKARMIEYLATADLPSLTAEEVTDIDNAGAKGPSYSFREVFALRLISLTGFALVCFVFHTFATSG